MKIPYHLLVSIIAGVMFNAAPAVSEEKLQQIELTEPMIQKFLAAQPDVTDITRGVNPDAQQIDPKVEAKLAETVKKHGFKDLAEYDVVVDNIQLAVDSIDPDTGQTVEPADAIKKELDAVKADSTMPPNEKDTAVKDLQTALQSAEPLKFPKNVELVRKYMSQLSAATGGK